METKKFTKHESKVCSLCKKEFECKVGSILECDCTSVKLTQVQRNYIAENFTDCLCVDCLKKITTDGHR